MSDHLCLQRDIQRAEEALNARLARIKADARAEQSADEATISAVEAMLAEPEPRAIDRIDCDADIEDDFGDEPDGWHWRGRVEDLVFELTARGHQRLAADLRRLAGVNALSAPFTADDEAEAIQLVLQHLNAMRRKLLADETDAADHAPGGETDAAHSKKPRKSGGRKRLSQQEDERRRTALREYDRLVELGFSRDEALREAGIPDFKTKNSWETTFRTRENRKQRSK